MLMWFGRQEKVRTGTRPKCRTRQNIRAHLIVIDWAESLYQLALLQADRPARARYSLFVQRDVASDSRRKPLQSRAVARRRSRPHSRVANRKQAQAHDSSSVSWRPSTA